ncbi:hypothetical protein [Sandaracinobacteroides saxicola]|uniref:Uncharacterized protein n=1 Tax=Sandaracinobacteroides saxicola TaxID=2759707 RepID=A0A7G5IKI0_9SPHN|nr:hypothetical protein [Sandaracinobacteroides saxicola]QMW23872.1 hypothetical protein H3309_05210 [Sandaracinobacteroides saxicola]
MSEKLSDKSPRAGCKRRFSALRCSRTVSALRFDARKSAFSPHPEQFLEQFLRPEAATVWSRIAQQSCKDLRLAAVPDDGRARPEPSDESALPTFSSFLFPAPDPAALPRAGVRVGNASL